MPNPLPLIPRKDHSKNVLPTEPVDKDEEQGIEVVERQADGPDGPDILSISDIPPHYETTSRPSTMQMIRAPPPLSYYRRQYLRATKCEYLQDASPMPKPPQPPQPPQSLFLPCGIVFLDGQWMQLSSGTTSWSSEHTDGRLYPKADFEITMGWKADKDATVSETKEIHNPFSPPAKPREKLTPYGRLMAMEGLDQTKEEFLNIKMHIDETSKREGQLRRQDLNLALLGNPGTGKRSIAALYRDFLVECGVWGDRKVPLTKVSGIGLTTRTIDTVADKLKKNSKGMVLLIDAVEYTEDEARAQLLDYLESYATSVVVVLTGSDDGVTKFLGSRPHGRWLFKRRLKLQDYDDEQLHRILKKLIQQHNLEVVEDEQNPYALIAARRVGRGRHSPGFGNAHDLLASFEKMVHRRSLRIRPSSETLPLQQESEPPEVFHRSTCDGPLCRDRQVRITGIRFKCTVCDDIDFCSKCEAYPDSGHDQAHPLIQFKVPVHELQVKQHGVEDNFYVKHESDDSDCSSESSDESSATETSTQASQEAIVTEQRSTTVEDLERAQASQKNLLTVEDILGEEPTDCRQISAAWKELERMVGLQDVKNTVSELLLRAKANWNRELHGQKPLATTLNRVFLGPPGTGKTTVAKLYGQILADIGVLSTKEVVYKTPADFISQFIGGSESKTMEILNATVGKVLIIDDAHMFYSGSRTTKGSSYQPDMFRLGIIDTLVSQLHNKPGEDRCVILIGYPDMMEEMYQNVNAGLERRFPLEEAFRFDNYDDEQLLKILELKMDKEEIKPGPLAMDVAGEVLRRARDRPNFGNGGDVDNILSQAKTRFRERITKEKRTRRSQEIVSGLKGMEEGLETVLDDGDIFAHGSSINILLKPEDFDPEWNRGLSASAKCEALFEGLIGFEGIISKLQGYQKTAANLRLHGENPRESIPFTFVFKGPPGSGKTHTARIIGQIFYDMGFLSTNEVIECSASQLVGQFMGQTGPTVINLFERALGKVLFIDEAYRLGSGARGRSSGSFQEEAIGEIVDCMTKPRFHKKMIIVLAGYTKDMEKLMSVNAGLRSRFATEICFPAMTAVRSREHLFNLLKKKQIGVRDEVPLDIEIKEKVLRLFDKLGMTAGWAGARDVGTLAAAITERVYRTVTKPDEGSSSDGQFSMTGSQSGMERDSSIDGESTKFAISTRDLVEFLKDMLRERIKSGRVK